METTHVFGPVSSRRLGSSLGIDIVPLKTCTFDCIYCEVGPTNVRTTEVRPYIKAGEILDELKKRFADRDLKLDYVTVTGSGEPTLNGDLGEIVRGIRSLTSTPIALLTNGSLFFRKDVRDAVRDVDIIIPSLDCADEESFLAVNRPHPSLDLAEIIRGLETLGREFKGRIWLEVLLTRGLNDGRTHLEKVKRAVEAIGPEKIQINTVVRPPAYSSALPLSPDELEAVRTYFGERAEVIASFSRHHMQTPIIRVEQHIMELLSRRPCPLEEICRSTGLDDGRITVIIDKLVNESRIHCELHEGKRFYLAA